MTAQHLAASASREPRSPSPAWCSLPAQSSGWGTAPLPGLLSVPVLICLAVTTRVPWVLVEEHVSLWGAWLSPAVTQASRRVRAAHGCEHQRAADRQSMTRNFCAERSSQHKGTQYDSRGWQCSQAQCFGGWRGALLQAARWEVQYSIVQSILDHLSMWAKEQEEVRESIF